MSDAVKWVGTALVLGVFGTAGYYAWQRGKANEAEHAAAEQAKNIIGTLAKCVAEQRSQHDGSLPPSARPMPPSLADLKGNPSAWDELATTAPYNCTKVAESGPLRSQVVWIQDQKEMSRFFARIDPDGDGKANAYFEAPLGCKPENGISVCAVAGDVYTIRDDGTRVPPLVVMAGRKALPYKGAPPALDDAMSLSRVDATPQAGEAQPAPARQDLPDLGAQLAGGKAPYALIVEGAQALATKIAPKATLVGFDVKSADGETIDPKNHEELELRFGQVDASERLAKGENLLVVLYTDTGLKAVQSMTRTEVRALQTPRCSVRDALKLGGGQAASLTRDPKQDRALWVVQGAKKGQTTQLDADTCAIVKR